MLPRVNPVDYYLVISVSFIISRTKKMKKSLSKSSVKELNVSTRVSDMAGALIISAMLHVVHFTKKLNDFKLIISFLVYLIQNQMYII